MLGDACSTLHVFPLATVLLLGDAAFNIKQMECMHCARSYWCLGFVIFRHGALV